MNIINKFPQVTWCTDNVGGKFIIYTTDDGEMNHVSKINHTLKEVYKSASYQRCISYCERNL